MRFHRLGFITKNQPGFTLIEILIALAIFGLIAAGITTAISQVFHTSARSSNHMTAVRQVQSAGYWISRDAHQAQSLVITGTSGFPLILSWTEWDGTAHQVTYTLVNSELWRDYDGQSMLVAQYIDPNITSSGAYGSGDFSLPDGNVPQDSFTITDPVGGDSGTISISSSGDVIKVTPTGGATINGGTSEVAINISNSPMAWSIPVAGGTLVVTTNSNSSGIIGSWTSKTGTAIANMTTDTDGDAFFSGNRNTMLTFTIRATVGGWQPASETRVYEVIPRSNL